MNKTMARDLAKLMGKDVRVISGFYIVREYISLSSISAICPLKKLGVHL